MHAAPAQRADRLAHAAARMRIAATTVTRQYCWPSSSTADSATGAAPTAMSTNIPHGHNTFFSLGTAALLCKVPSASGGGGVQGWLGKRYRMH